MNVKRRILDLAFAVFRTAAKHTPKKKDLVLFGARRGLWYMDNSRQVFEWTLENRPDLKPVWITRSRDVEAKLKSRGLPVCHAFSPRSFYLLMRAPLAVTSTQLYDITSIPECPPDNLRIIFLGHGKSIKASSLAKKGPRSDWTRALFQRKSELIDVGISTSPFISQLAAKSNGLTPDRFKDTGYPVNDALLHPPGRAERRFQEYVGDLEPRKTVLYAPTWRPCWRDGLERTRFFPFPDFDKDSLVRYLERNRVLLLLRPHEMDLLNSRPLREFLTDLSEGEKWIRVCDQHTFGNVNEILPFTDAMISDYSSVYHDYLLLDRPILFCPYDYDAFEQAIGFMFDYFEHLPGPVLESQQDLISRLDEILLGKDGFRQRRHALRSMIHTHTDGRATERVVQIIDQRMNGKNGDNNHEIVRIGSRQRNATGPGDEGQAQMLGRP